MKSITELLKAILTFRPARNSQSFNYRHFFAGSNWVQKDFIESAGTFQKGSSEILEKRWSCFWSSSTFEQLELCRHFVAFENIYFTEWLKKWHCLCFILMDFTDIYCADVYENLFCDKPESRIPAIKIPVNRNENWKEQTTRRLLDFCSLFKWLL